MDDLISRVAAVRIIADMHGLCRNDVLRESIQAIKEMPTINAILVEWLREKIKEHTDKEGWQDYLANSFGLCIEEWRHEDEKDTRFCAFVGAPVCLDRLY